jgi:hypothetical protein
VKRKIIVTTLTLSVISGALISTRIPLAKAEDNALHITKNCSAYTGAPGDYCTITTSNVAAIKPGSKVYYDQGFGVPPGMLDSNVLLSVGPGDWAVGRCTLDGTTGNGLCTFTDGVGPLTGFKARIVVSLLPSGVDYLWQGTYSLGLGRSD